MKKPNTLQIDTQVLHGGAMVLRAVKNKLRQQILQLIDKRQGIKVTYVYIALRLEQSVASQHLAILRKESFVIAERSGKEIYYSINYKRFLTVDTVIKKLLEG